MIAIDLLLKEVVQESALFCVIPLYRVIVCCFVFSPANLTYACSSHSATPNVASSPIRVLLARGSGDKEQRQ